MYHQQHRSRPVWVRGVGAPATLPIGFDRLRAVDSALQQRLQIHAEWFFSDAAALEQGFRCDVEQLAACFRSMRVQIEAYKAVRRMAMSVMALHVAAKTIDYYITKHAAKPMEQPQNLMTPYALGLRRLELAEAEEQTTAKDTSGGVVQPACAKARGRRLLLRPAILCQPSQVDLLD